MGICMQKTLPVKNPMSKPCLPMPITQDTHIGGTDESKAQNSPSVHRTKYKRVRQKKGSGTTDSTVDPITSMPSHQISLIQPQTKFPCLYSAFTRPSSVSTFPQDGFSLDFEGSTALLAVFAGSGITGGKLSDFAKTALSSLVFSHIEASSDINSALKSAIGELRDQIFTACKTSDSEIDCENSGTTISLVLLKEGKMHVAHVGDSRILLANTKDGLTSVKQLTVPHTPSNERERLDNFHCEVKTLADSRIPRLYTKGTDVPGLCVSRSIGYTAWTDLGITSDVDLIEREVEDEDEFVVISSAGVNEVVGKEETAEVVKSCSGEEAAEKLTQLAWSRHVHLEGEVVEDLTALVCYLPKR